MTEFSKTASRERGRPAGNPTAIDEADGNVPSLLAGFEHSTDHRFPRFPEKSRVAHQDNRQHRRVPPGG